MAFEDEIKTMMYGADTEDGDEQTDDYSEPTEEKDEGTEGKETEGGEEAQDDQGYDSAQTGETEEAEETLEQRYTRILGDLNAANAKLLQFESQHPQVQHSLQQEQMQEPTASEQFRVKLDLPKLDINKELIEKALLESDTGAFMEIITKVAEHVASVSDVYHTNSLRSVPEMATKMAMDRMKLQTAIDAFYGANEDLIPHNATVGMITNQIVAENPHFKLQEVFAEAEKRTRKLLGLKRKVESDQATGGRKNFAKKSGTRKPGAHVLTGLKGEIATMQSVRR